jgi:type IV pilus assembly protein PilB
MENNICTVEDPIEYHLPLINQFQVQERVGLTFRRRCARCLRQDPDVIMVGEIRDEETARTAIQAALTGHLVFSTLHTNDAPVGDHAAGQHGGRAVPDRRRAQRGAGPAAGARICGKCREEYEPAAHAAQARSSGWATRWRSSSRGVGCRKCRNTGYSGRLGVHELLMVNDELRDAIVAGKSVAELRRIAATYNMVTLRHDGFRKVRHRLQLLWEPKP